MNLVDAFAEHGIAVETDVPLAPFTTWRIGGPAKLLWHAEADRLAKAIEIARSVGSRLYFFGRGSNLLIDDAGIDGLVICTRKTMLGMEDSDGLVVAEAGVPLPKLSKRAADLGFAGYDFLIGIPGNVGAGVAINAGLLAKGTREIGALVEWVDVIDRSGAPQRLSAEDCRFRDRGSRLLDEGMFVVRAAFRLEREGDPAEIQRLTREHLEDRRRKQPLNENTAGSTFKKPPGGQASGWYIEQAGLKGHRIGGAHVSQKHANWIVNDGSASSEDVRQLIELIVERVWERFEVRLEREVRYLPQDLDALARAAQP